jgi:beta-lactamase regulating signal transducer with metallopeptidase domain
MISVLRYLIESGVCLGLFYLIYRIFLSRETFFRTNRLYLLFGIPLSFAIPLINIPSPFVTAENLGARYFSSSGTGAVPQSFGLVDILWIVYLLGALFFLVCFGYKLAQLSILIKKYGHQKCGNLKLVFIEEDTAPFSFFHYFFLNKSNISQHDLLRIIDHELVHINQHHSIDLIIIELLTIVQWFNPFVRPYKKSLKETHEYLADNQVIAQGCSRAKYQLLIFEQHVGMNLFEFVNNFNHSLIKRRITMMTKGKSKSWAKSKFLLLVPVICFLVLAFANPKPATSTDHAFAPATAIDQKTTDETKQKEQQKKLTELMEKEKELKELYEKTDNPEKKKIIKEKLAEIQQAMEKDGLVEENGPKIISEKEYEETTNKIKTMLETTEDPKKREQLEAKLKDLQEMKTKGLVKPTNIDYEKEALILKEMYEKEKDPEKKKMIKEKLVKLKELAAKEKEKKDGK